MIVAKLRADYLAGKTGHSKISMSCHFVIIQLIIFTYHPFNIYVELILSFSTHCSYRNSTFEIPIIIPHIHLWLAQ